MPQTLQILVPLPVVFAALMLGGVMTAVSIRMWDWYRNVYEWIRRFY